MFQGVKLVFLSFFLITMSYAKATNVECFQKLFNEWTEGFNQKQLKKTCQLFSKSLVATYQGIPQKNYHTICNGFKKIFKEQNKRYHYHFKLHHVYREAHFAAVRITWYLSIFENGKLVSTTQDEGIDIFKKNNKGQWQIINFIAFPVEHVE